MINIPKTEFIKMLQSSFKSNIIPFKLILAVIYNNFIGPKYASNVWTTFGLRNVSITQQYTTKQ